MAIEPTVPRPNKSFFANGHFLTVSNLTNLSEYITILTSIKHQPTNNGDSNVVFIPCLLVQATVRNPCAKRFRETYNPRATRANPQRGDRLCGD